MTSGSIPANAPSRDRPSARIALVEEHIRLENAHDLKGVFRTLGDTPQYDDEAWGEHFKGATGVHSFYEQLMAALPDLQIEVQSRHISDDAVVMEVLIHGTHLAHGAVFRPQGEKSRSPYAVCTPSTPPTGSPVKRSITTAAQSSGNSASSTNQKV